MPYTKGGMQFQVPQFIEVEDKIFGPFTFKQFVYIAGGAGMCYILWRYLPLYASAPLILTVGGAAALFAIGTWNGRPFRVGLENAFYFFVSPKLYLWSHERRKKKQKEEVELHVAQKNDIYIPTLSESKLHQLAWSLDVQEKLGSLSREEREKYDAQNRESALQRALGSRVQ